MANKPRQLPEGFEEFRPDGKPRCWGRSKSRGYAQCPNTAMKEQHVCRYHGGLAPQNLKAAEERIMEAKVRQLVATYGLKVETTPTQALLDEVQWTAGHVAWLRERVQEIESSVMTEGTDREHPLVWGITREKVGGEDRGITSEAAPNIWLKLYQAERVHLVKVCEAALRAGVEERMVRVAETQGAKVADALRGIFGALNLTAEQQALVPQIVPRYLRALTAA